MDADWGSPWADAEDDAPSYPSEKGASAEPPRTDPLTKPVTAVDGSDAFALGSSAGNVWADGFGDQLAWADADTSRGLTPAAATVAEREQASVVVSVPDGIQDFGAPPVEAIGSRDLVKEVLLDDAWGGAKVEEAPTSPVAPAASGLTELWETVQDGHEDVATTHVEVENGTDDITSPEQQLEDAQPLPEQSPIESDTIAVEEETQSTGSLETMQEVQEVIEVVSEPEPEPEPEPSTAPETDATVAGHAEEERISLQEPAEALEDSGEGISRNTESIKEDEEEMAKEPAENAGNEGAEGVEDDDDFGDFEDFADEGFGDPVEEFDAVPRPPSPTISTPVEAFDIDMSLVSKLYPKSGSLPDPPPLEPDIIFTIDA